MILATAVRVIDFDQLIVSALGVRSVSLELKDLVRCGYRSLWEIWPKEVVRAVWLDWLGMHGSVGSPLTLFGFG